MRASVAASRLEVEAIVRDLVDFEEEGAESGYSKISEQGELSVMGLVLPEKWRRRLDLRQFSYELEAVS